MRRIQNKFLCPKDTHFRHISNTRGDHFRQQYYKSLHPKDIPRILNTRGDHIWHSFQGHFRAHISNTRGDHFWQHSTSLLIPRTPIFVHVFQTLEVTISAALQQVPLSQGHPFSCAYFKHSSPFPAVTIHFRARISNTRRDLLGLQPHKSFHAKDIRFRARILYTRGYH